jgi:mono/diheme cytochrome c family protein
MRSVLVNHDVNGDLIGPVIQGGRADKGMPKFSMTQAQIADIATFLHARNQYIRDWSQYQVKVVVKGDAAAGERYFKGTGGCSSCHSPSGDLAHVAERYDPETLLKHMLYPAGHPPSDSAPLPAGHSPMTVTATVKLPSGETVSGPLRHIDEFSVSLYDSSGDYRSWNRDAVKVEVHDPLEKHVALLAQYTDSDMHNLLAYLETLK